MTSLRQTLILTGFQLLLAFAAVAQMEPDLEVWSLDPAEGQLEFDMTTGVATGTNGVLIKYGNASLIADRVSVNQQTGDAIADGRVRIQRDDQIWAGEHIRYNFKTRQMEAEQFRTGRPPVFAQGVALAGDTTNQVYSGRDAYVTTDDVSEPFEKIRAKYIRIIPGKSFQARHATLYLGKVPVFYFPYYSHSLEGSGNRFTFTPGARSQFGAYLLGTYTWAISEQLDGALHVDYRTRRGPGAGPDVNVHLGRWGEAGLKYYYLYDYESETDAGGLSIPSDRQRLNFAYDATPFTNFTVKSLVRYQSDPLLLHDFFEGEYRQNPQPNTYFEANQLWDNFSLDAFVQPRVNDFFETVERLPEVKLTGFRQQIGATLLFYESESSAGYYRRRFAETNDVTTGLDYSAGRADTYHQLTIPRTFFGWLNVAPRVGGRFTWYSESSGPGATNSEVSRGVFNTGIEASFKASRVWPAVTNGLLALDGLRHIFEPSANYVYVPAPRRRPPELPQFDSELPSLRLLPIEYPDYNAVDAIDSQNVIRFGLRNKLQTKRDGQIESVVDWDVYTDWRLRPDRGQTTFADVYSDLAFRPRSWLRLASLTRYDMHSGRWRMSFTELTLQPNDTWHWSLGHFYLRDDLSESPTALGVGNNLIRSTLFYRLNENWAVRATQHFEARDGRMEEQFYTLYRDFRSWTGALTFRARDHRDGRDDYTVAFSFSLKARPRYGVGGDAVRPYDLLGN